VSDAEDSEDGSFGDGGRRRVRRRRHDASPADMPDHAPAPSAEPDPGKRVAAMPERPDKVDKADKVERGLRGLVGAGPSQVPLSAAMRARDAARPSEADLAAAEELPIVRRNYVPPDDSKR